MRLNPAIYDFFLKGSVTMDRSEQVRLELCIWRLDV
jgi:hypothetical protein